MDKRYTKFKKLRATGKTLQQIGSAQNPPISQERVRQILNPIKMICCPKHKIKYTGICQYCYIELQYPKVLKTLYKQGPGAFKTEFDRLSKADRTKETVIQRTLLIKFMRDRLKLSLFMIADSLKRDYTSVKHLYDKTI